MSNTGNIQLDDWQKEILKHKGHMLLCTGRQVGKTTIFAIKAAEYLINNPNSKIIVVSLTEDQAKLIIVMILDYLEKHHKKELAKGKNKPTQNKIHLINKSQVIARPVGTTGDAVRGFTGDVLIIDEASRMPELVWTASKPTLLTTAGEIWMCSTPFGKQGYFWEAFQNKNDRFKVFHISSEEVIKNRPITDSWTEHKRDEAIRFLQEEKKDMSELQYGQEYLGLFLDDLRQYFSDEWIDSVCSLESISPFNPQREYFLGVDIARLGGDETSFEALRLLETPNKHKKPMFEHAHHETRTKTLTTWTENRILELNEIFKFKKIYIDAGAGSLGVGVFDHLLKEPKTSRKVVAINNRAISQTRDGSKKQRLVKEDLYDNLRNLGEKGQIKLLDEEQVRLSLKSVQYEFNSNDKSLSKMRIFGNYTHIAEALIRAAWAAKEKIINIHIYSI